MRELENDASAIHTEIQCVCLTIQAEPDHEPSHAVELSAVVHRDVDPLIDHGARSGDDDVNLGSVKVHGDIAEVGKLLTVDDGCHFFFCIGKEE